MNRLSFLLSYYFNRLEILCKQMQIRPTPHPYRSNNLLLSPVCSLHLVCDYNNRHLTLFTRLTHTQNTLGRHGSMETWIPSLTESCSEPHFKTKRGLRAAATLTASNDISSFTHCPVSYYNVNGLKNQHHLTPLCAEAVKNVSGSYLRS